MSSRLGGGRRRLKKLVKELGQMQQDDAPVSGPFLMKIKMAFRSTKLCSHVDIETDPGLSLSDPMPREWFSNFVVSQFEAQRLVPRYVSEIQINLVLGFLHSALLEFNRQRLDGHPTLLRWHHRTKHRTYCVFVRLPVKMESRKYTLSELIHLKYNPEPSLLLKKFEEDPELGEI